MSNKDDMKQICKLFMNIIIIGATSGIGKELWKLYAIEDNHVAILGRRKHLLEQMYQNITDKTNKIG